jgi:hypothetical protein
VKRNSKRESLVLRINTSSLKRLLLRLRIPSNSALNCSIFFSLAEIRPLLYLDGYGSPLLGIQLDSGSYVTRLLSSSVENRKKK